MVVVYPLTVQIDNTELRYSLRSLDKYLHAPFEVVLVGDIIPEWLTNITQIELPDVRGQHLYSVRRKVIAALQYASEVFFMNDDIYLLDYADSNFPYYSSGLLDKKAESGAKPLTLQLQQKNKPTKYFGHYPCIYRKDFIDIVNQFTNDCIPKSAYCNCIDAESVEVADCKILTSKKAPYIKEFIKGKPCFSTGVYSIKEALPLLQQLFPKPSKFELQ